MAAILAKKLGMTQLFLDDGRVERVTVLEAGPCPVTGIRTHERDGYEAVQLAFGAGDKVKISGISKGKGFAGPIKRHNFKSGPKSHGSHNIRKPGSIGASATPSRVFKGIRMAGHMGGKRVTQIGLVVHGVVPEENLLLVKGSVPGPKNGFVEVREEAR